MRALVRNKRHVPYWAVCAALLLSSALLAACGSSGGGGSFTPSAKNSAEISPTIPASGCGSVSVPAAKDPDGVLAALPASYQAEYAGYTRPVSKSPWANFKPDHGPPYTVGVSFSQLSNPTQKGLYDSIIKGLKADPDIRVKALTTSSQLDVPQQLQQFSSLVDQGADLMIVEPLTDAFGPSIVKSAKKNVPTISVLNTTDSPYAVNVVQNFYGQGAQAASMVMRQTGKGNALYVHGIASTAADADSFQPYKAVLKNCPDIKQVGEIAGAFVSSTAKAETLKFLATHPEQIDVVMETGGMAAGIISAFKSAGRPVPLVADAAGLRGSLAFWQENQDTYHGFSLGFPPGRYGTAIASVAKRMLAGRGVKTGEVIQREPLVEDLDKWADPAWNLNTPGSSEGPPGNFFSEDYLSAFFNDPAPAE